MSAIHDNIRTWSDEKWKSFIDYQVDLVLSSSSHEHAPTTPFTSISSASDPALPLAIDHTLLKPEATLEQVDKLCDEALQHGFKSCCVNSLFAKRVSERLKGSSTLVCCVIGFPLGAGSAEAKAAEARVAIKDGAEEIDMVLPVGLLLSTAPPYSEIYQHLKKVITAAHPVPVKVIIETGLLKSPEKEIAACVLAAEAGAAFVKTCTGFSEGEATEEDVRLMWHAVKRFNSEGVKVRVKASGGVRTLESCLAMFKAGAERVGTSSGVALASPSKHSDSGSY